MMYAKSFMALDGNDRLTGARTSQTAPYDRYRCHLCDSAMTFHPAYHTERLWFEHRHNALTARGRHCPYVKPERGEIRRIKMLRIYVPDAMPLVRKADWLCTRCNRQYHGERYCMSCHTGEHSSHTSQPEASLCKC